MEAITADHLLFDENNLFDTAKMCKADNESLADMSETDIEELFKSQVLEYCKSPDFSELQLQPIYGAFFDIVKTPDNFKVEVVGQVKSDTYMVNFYIRPGANWNFEYVENEI